MGRVGAIEGVGLLGGHVVHCDRTEAESKIVRRLIEWARNHGLEDNFRQGQRGSAFIPVLRHGDCPYYPVSVQKNGNIVIQMRWLKDHPPFDEATKREEVLKKIQGIPNLKIVDAGMEGFPKFPILSLSDEKQLKSFIDALDWIVAENGSIALAMTAALLWSSRPESRLWV